MGTPSAPQTTRSDCSRRRRRGAASSSAGRRARCCPRGATRAPKNSRRGWRRRRSARSSCARRARRRAPTTRRRGTRRRRRRPPSCCGRTMPGLEDHADFRARLTAASEPAPVPKMLGIVEALKAGARRLSGIGSTKDLSHLAGAEGSVSTSGKSPGSTPGKAGRRRSSFELIGKGWAGLRGKRLSQIVVAAQKGEEKGLEAAAAGGMTFRPSEATHAAYNGTAKVHDGWMVKRPEKFGKAQRRWFVLHEDGRMHYFEDSSCATQKGVARHPRRHRRRRPARQVDARRGEGQRLHLPHPHARAAWRGQPGHRRRLQGVAQEPPRRRRQECASGGM